MFVQHTHTHNRQQHMMMYTLISYPALLLLPSWRCCCRCCFAARPFPPGRPWEDCPGASLEGSGPEKPQECGADSRGALHPRTAGVCWGTVGIHCCKHEGAWGSQHQQHLSGHSCCSQQKVELHPTAHALLAAAQECVCRHDDADTPQHV